MLSGALLRAADRGVRVRILVDDGATVQSAYQRYRAPLLEGGVELYEVRSLLGSVGGSGQTALVSRYGNYALHAKLYVFDRQKIFMGSMNFDQRSERLNTEVGLIIDSPDLAQQTAARFDAMVRPENSYALALRPRGAAGRPRLVWRTEEGGKSIEYAKEPARSSWQRARTVHHHIAARAGGTPLRRMMRAAQVCFFAESFTSCLTSPNFAWALPRTR